MSQCQPGTVINLPDAEGYLSGKTSLVSQTCTWEINAQQGQKVDISIIDFEPKPSGQPCNSLGYIADNEANKNVTMCKPSQRAQHVYASKGRNIQMFLNSHAQGEDVEGYVLHYKGRR